jgi:short subunit dehydrogenase-like uncharacterized protein
MAAKDAGIDVPGVGLTLFQRLARQTPEGPPAVRNASRWRFTVWGGSRWRSGTMTMNVGKAVRSARTAPITSVPAAWKTREIDFGEVTKDAVTIPWGDVATAYYSTGIPNVEVFTVVPPSNLKMLKLSRYLGWLLATKPLQDYLQKQIPVGGPSDEERAKGKTLLWGEATDLSSNRVESRMQGPRAVRAALAISIAKILKVTSPRLSNSAKHVNRLILEIDGVSRQDVRMADT